MKILLLGSNGFLGSNFNKFLQNKNCELYELNRKNCNFLNKDDFFNKIKNINPLYIINCAGYTGKPNVDSCEINKESCWNGNVTLVKYLSDICYTLNTRYIQVSSGCIYTGTRGKNGFTEVDEPNFCFDHQPCSYYSGTKAVMEDILKCDYNAYVCRLRIPFNNISNPKNYITKLINYDTLLDATNSLTNIDDFLNACFYLLKNNMNTGIYNITNTGSISTKKVTKLISKYIVNKKFTFFKNENEFYSTAAKTPRSNCILDNKKLLDTGFQIEHVEDSILKSIKNYTNVK
jgi:UDP-glucose 4,6-dehydratase